MSYILAIKINKCNKTTKSTCLEQLSYGCKQGINSCKYPIENNPLCTCARSKSCPRRYCVIQDRETKDKYIFYTCRGCEHLVNNSKKITYKLLTCLNNDKYIYGNNLKKLAKKLTKDIPETKTSVDVKFFKNLFSTINPGVRL